MCANATVTELNRSQTYNVLEDEHMRVMRVICKIRLIYSHGCSGNAIGNALY